MNNLKPVLVMPAIYHFDIPEAPEASNWGWHRTSELAEAIQNILASQGKNEITLEELSENCFHAYPCKRKGWMNAVTVIRDGRAWSCSLGSVSWLKTLLKSYDFVPAKIGTSVIETIKHPLRGSIKKAWAAINAETE